MFQELAMVICFHTCQYCSIGDKVIEERFVDVLQGLDYGMRSHAWKERFLECTAASPSFKLLMSI